MSFPMALFVIVLLLIGSGFFVAAEFALVAAKRHRMEKAAADGRSGAKPISRGMEHLRQGGDVVPVEAERPLGGEGGGGCGLRTCDGCPC